MAENKTPTIRSIYDPTDEQKAVIKMVYDRRRQMEDSEDRQKFMNDLDQWEKQYEGFREPRGEDEWQSNHTVPMTLSVVETALSEIIKQNLRPFILPRGAEDEMKARVMQHIWDYAWEVSDGDLTTYDAVKEILISGIVIAQEIYRVEKRKIGNIVQDEKGVEKVEEITVTDYEDVDTEIVKHQDFYIDEFARSFKGAFAARDCIRRYLMDIDEFHRQYDGSIWDQYGDAKYVKAGGQDLNYYEFYKPPTGVNTSKQVEVLHYWNKPSDKFIIVANDVLIRNKPNPYKHKQLPFVRGVDIKRVHRFYAKGEPELLESIQDEVNTLRRMIIDRNHLDIDKMFLVSNKLGITDEDLIARPHGMIPVDDVNASKPVDYNDIPRSVELSLKHLEDDATISTGINPRSQALPTAGTATEAAILKESTLRRIETKIFLLKKEYFMRLGRLRLSNILQFYSQPKLEKIIGEKNSEEFKQKVSNLQSRNMLVDIGGEKFEKSFRQIRVEGKKLDTDEKGKIVETSAQGFSFFELNPEYFMPVERGGYDIKFNVGANIEISKPLMQSKILELYDRISQVALQVPGSYDPVKLADMVIRDYFDKNPDEFKPEQPQMEESEKRLQLQIELAGMENQMLMRGQVVPATEYASTAHTLVHVEFMNSETFQKVPNDSPIVRNFTEHVMGEIMAQETRNLQGVGAAPKVDMPMMDPMQQQAGTQKTRVGQGMENRPNGMKKPVTKVGDVMPSLQTGGNKNLP